MDGNTDMETDMAVLEMDVDVRNMDGDMNRDSISATIVPPALSSWPQQSAVQCSSCHHHGVPAEHHNPCSAGDKLPRSKCQPPGYPRATMFRGTPTTPGGLGKGQCHPGGHMVCWQQPLTRPGGFML